MGAPAGGLCPCLSFETLSHGSHTGWVAWVGGPRPCLSYGTLGIAGWTGRGARTGDLRPRFSLGAPGRGDVHDGYFASGGEPDGGHLSF